MSRISERCLLPSSAAPRFCSSPFLFHSREIPNNKRGLWTASGSFLTLRCEMEQAFPSVCDNSWSKFAPIELRWLAQQIGPLLRWHLASFLLIAAASSLALVPPLALGWLIDKVLPGRQFILLLGSVAVLFLSYQARTLLTAVAGYLTMTAAQRMSLSVRMSAIRHLDTLSAEYYDQRPVGSVIYPLREPIEEIAYFGSDLLPSLLRLVLTVLFTLVTMLALSVGLTLAVLPLIPTFLMVRQHFRRRLTTMADTVQQGHLAWADFLHEHFSAVIPIQLLGQERRQERRAFLLLGRLAHSEQRVFKSSIAFTVFTSLSIALAMSLAFGYGGWTVFTGRLSAGRLVTFYSLIAQLFDPLAGATEIYVRAQKMFANIRQVRKVFREQPSVVDSPAPVRLSENSARLDISHAEFRYPRQNAKLRVPSLHILAGEQVAVVGENGAGKSTFAKLLTRIYDVQAGSICLGGQDIRDVELKCLRKRVCYLPRDPILFHGTLASNLRFARPSASDGELQEALHGAGLSLFLNDLEGGLREEIGRDGCQLSGGQRQRLAIARAVLQRPQILILDEATSCLDPVSEQLVLGNLRRSLPAATMIVITHRLSTVAALPRVLVLSAGRIVEDGNPTSLANHSHAFSSLFSSARA